MVKSQWLKGALIAVLPIVYVITYLIVGGKRGPYYWTPNQDPDYAYLTNSLVLALFRVPQHTDHPGTPLQILGAIVLWVSYGVQSLLNPALKQNLTDEVLTNPELYLTLFNGLLIFVTACSLIAVGWVALRLSHSWLLALILQISPLLMIRTFLGEEPSRVAPDVLVVCISQLLVLVLIRYLYLENWERSRPFILSLGAVMGVGMATKVTFLPMMIFLLLPQGWRRKAMTLGVAIITFVIATLPILSRYPRTFRWMTGIATRSGPYGGGDVGLVDASSLSRNAALLLSHNVVFFTLLIIATATWIGFAALWRFQDERLQVNRQSPEVRKIFFLLALTSIASWGQVILTLNEQPQSRYLNPAAGLMGFLVFLLVQMGGVIIPLTIGRLNSSRFNASRFNAPRLNVALPAIALALCIAISIQQASYSDTKIASNAKRRMTELSKIEKILQRDQYKSCVKVVSRRASTPESALKFADFWTGKKLSKQLGNLYPNPVFYIDDEKGYETFDNRPVNLSTLATQGKGCVLLEINAMPIKNRRAARPKEAIDKVFEGRLEALYRLEIDSAPSS